jgi:hypothetical protein
MRQRGIRNGAYPESHIYQDTGCELHSACLTCPFEVCRHDLHTERADMVVRRQMTLKLTGEGMTAKEIALRLGISYTAVRRYKGSAR